MKILHVSKFYPPYRGGIEDVCYNIVQALQEHTQKVFCFNDKKTDSISVINNVEIIRIGTCIELASQPISFSYYIKLKKVIHTFNPDIIHLHLPNPLACLFILKLIPIQTKLILHWHSDIIAQKLIYQIFRPIEKNILKRANKILVTSPQYLEGSKPLFFFKQKCIVIPNPISIEKLNMTTNDYTYKGIKYLIEAEKYIKSECIILIAGKGPLTQSLKKDAIQSERIQFLGKIPDEEIKIYMHSASIFAFPSITKNEAFGVVLAEAMYCKATPVCFTIKGSGVNWVNINGKTGLEVENKNVKAFAQAIETLLSDDQLRLQLSENAHQRIKELFTMNTIEKQIKNIYQNI